MCSMKTLFKNGTIYDGSGAKPCVGDVLIEDDRIVRVGGTITEAADFLTPSPRAASPRLKSVRRESFM